MRLADTLAAAARYNPDHPAFLIPHQRVVLSKHRLHDPMGLKWTIGKNPHDPVPKYDIRGTNSAKRLYAEILAGGALV
jgi:hypothetical protein